MDNLTIDELKLMRKSLCKTLADARFHVNSPEHKTALSLMEKIQDALSDAMYESKDLPW